MTGVAAAVTPPHCLMAAPPPSCQGLERERKVTGEVGPSGPASIGAGRGQLGNLHSCCLGSIWAVNNWRVFHHQGCQFRYLQALSLVVSF